jgi:WD40 repeat protein
MSTKREKPEPQEFIVIHKSQENNLPKKNVFDRFEQLARIISIVAIPVIIAVVGWLIQSAVTQQNISRDYVQIAVGILTNSDSSVDPAIRSWAVDLLNDNAPTKFDSQTVARLKTGELTIPSNLVNSLISNGAGLAISPNGSLLVTGDADGTVHVWDIKTGTEISRMKHNDIVNCMAFSPDGKIIATGSNDKTARLWDLNTGREIVRVVQNSAVIGLVFTPDGKNFITRALDKKIILWDASTGKQVSTINLPQ